MTIVFKALDLSSLESLVIDEADLILSYGHNADVRSILSSDLLPRVYQSFLMSATMTSDVEALKGLVLRNPVCLICQAKAALDPELPSRLFCSWMRKRMRRRAYPSILFGELKPGDFMVCANSPSSDVAKSTNSYWCMLCSC